MTPRQVCRCGHGRPEHRIELKRAQPCWVRTGPDATPCPCLDFEEAT